MLEFMFMLVLCMVSIAVIGGTVLLQMDRDERRKNEK